MTNNIPDSNMVSQTTVDEQEIAYFDVRMPPFSVFGLYNYRTEELFRRMPDEVAATVSPGVRRLAANSAGGRLRFSTDSLFVAIRARMPSIYHTDHFALTGSAGFDLYLNDPDSGASRFVRPFRPSVTMSDGYESKISFKERKLRHFTIHFPSYSNVSSLEIGIEPTAALGEGLPYRDMPPIVYYGSSITQGACPSRPGNTYPNIICRRNNINYINLGFSGNGKGEQAIADYMAGLEMSAFVSDYDYNAPSVAHLKETHFALYETIRAAHPDIPYIMISRPDADHNYPDTLRRRDLIAEHFRRARRAGDSNVYFIDGTSIFRGPYEGLCTVDAIHPNDLGFALMADAIGAELDRAFTQKLF